MLDKIYGDDRQSIAGVPLPRIIRQVPSDEKAEPNRSGSRKGCIGTPSPVTVGQSHLAFETSWQGNHHHPAGRIAQRGVMDPRTGSVEF
jgi:hypothetical protein